MRRVGGLAGLVAGVALAAGVASAHELDATAFQSPIPLPFLYAGAGATVAVTAGMLGYGDHLRLPSPESPVVRLSPRVVQTGRTLARGGALALFAAVLVHGLAGPTAPAENLATVVVWPLALKGVALVAVVAGSPWRFVSPWETLYDLLVALEGNRIAFLGEYPARLGSWPAVVGLVAGVGVLENLTVATRSPSLTVAVVGVYAALMLAGSVAFGREWFARADVLTVLFGLFGRVAPLRVERTGDGGARIRLRPPWRGCVDPVADGSVVVFVVATVYTVSFDGFTATATYQDALSVVRDALGPAVSAVALYLAGLALFVAGYQAAAALAGRFAPTTVHPEAGRTASFDRGGAATAFAGTVVPIAAAYEVAHNYPYVAANLGRVLDVGRELVLGTHGTVSLLGWLPVAGFWATQVVLVVGGHVVGVVAAHQVASVHTATTAAARRVHLPLVVVMVAYTVLSLWIVSQPLAA